MQLDITAAHSRAHESGCIVTARRGSLRADHQPIDSMPMPRAALGTESLHTLRLGERIIHLRGRVFTEWVIDRVLGLY